MSDSAQQVSAVSCASAHKLFSFGRTFAIAGNTFRDLVRQKVFYFMLIFALILLGQVPPLLALPGVVLVVAGVALVVRASRPQTLVEPGT